MEIKADMHVHTFLSSCAKRDALPENYLALCPGENIDTICFTDHFWDEKVDGASSWYKPQNLEHVRTLRSRIPAGFDGIRVLFGAETEFIGSRMCKKEGGIAGLAEETAENFDFVLIPPNHFHMKGYTIPAAVTDPHEIRLWFIDNFIEAAKKDFPIPAGIAHPFDPMGFDEAAALTALQLITDDDLRRCFDIAAEHKKSIELNHCIFNDRYYDQYIRIFTTARECGCTFHAGSDAHTPSSFANHSKIAEFADRCGIRSEHFISI